MQQRSSRWSKVGMAVMAVTGFCFSSWLAAAPAAETAQTKAPATVSAPAADQQSTALMGITADNLPANFEFYKQQMTYPQSWLSGHFHNFAQWKKQTRAMLRAALLTPDSTQPFKAEVLQQEDRGTYIAEKIQLTLTDNNRVNAYLLTPKTAGTHAAILLLHDHGAKFDIGKEKFIRPWGDPAKLASAKAWAHKYFTDEFVGDDLAKRGYVVLCVDALGWGDRGPISYEGQQALASNFFNLGRSLAGQMAYEDMRSVDYLATRDDVDAHRIGVIGFSMGAFRAWQVAALDDKVQATAAVSWFGSLKGLMTPGNNVLRGQSSFYMLHPGIAAKLDFPDIAGLAAPKPMLFFNGGQDKLFPQSSVMSAYLKVHEIWKSQHAEDKLVTKIWPQLGHVFYKEQQDVVFPWMDQWLHPQTVGKLAVKSAKKGA